MLGVDNERDHVFLCKTGWEAAAQQRAVAGSGACSLPSPSLEELAGEGRKGRVVVGIGRQSNKAVCNSK